MTTIKQQQPLLLPIPQLCFISSSFPSFDPLIFLLYRYYLSQYFIWFSLLQVWLYNSERRSTNRDQFHCSVFLFTVYSRMMGVINKKTGDDKRFGVVLGWCLMLMMADSVSGIGANWGTQASHPLSPTIVVRLLQDNGFQKVKLFDADSVTLNALSNSRIQVMVGIPNEMLYTLANSLQAAENWVAKNVSAHVSSSGVDIRYVAVGNEPFLNAYNGTFLGTTYPALQNIQSALIKAGVANQVKITVPLNADVYQSSTGFPSGGDFRTDIHDLMLEIVKFLSDNGGAFTVNIYPFISLYNDANFPVDYAFFDGFSSPINDNGVIYDNVFDANYDTLVSALRKNGYDNLSIIIGEIGWPTDGDRNANNNYAQRFNQGFMSKMGKGTPLRPGTIDAYLFSLIDEDAKSIDPGNFERHWGIFYFDGMPKYQFNLGTTNSRVLVPAKGVQYLDKKWCVMAQSANLDGSDLGPSVSYACENADCTSLGYETSCGNLDARGNISYAFNSYYQQNNQLDTACKFPNLQFPNLSVVTGQDPSVGNCTFKIMIKTTTPAAGAQGGVGSLDKCFSLVVLASMFLFTIL